MIFEEEAKTLQVGDEVWFAWDDTQAPEICTVLKTYAFRATLSREIHLWSVVVRAESHTSNFFLTEGSGFRFFIPERYLIEKDAFT